MELNLALNGLQLRVDKITDRLDSLIEYLNNNQNELEVKLVQRLESINNRRNLEVDMKIEQTLNTLSGFRSEFKVEFENFKEYVDKKIVESINKAMADWIRQHTVQNSENAGETSPDSEKKTLIMNLGSDFMETQMKDLLNQVLKNQIEAENRIQQANQKLSEELNEIKTQLAANKRNSTGQNKEQSHSHYPSKSQTSNSIKETQNYNIKNDPVLQSALQDIRKPKLSLTDTHQVAQGYKWEITNFKERIGGSEKIVLHSSTFSLHGYSFSCQAKLEHSTRQGMQLAISFTDLSKTEIQPNFKALPQVVYTLRDVMNTSKKHRIRVRDYLFGEATVNEFNKYYFEELLGYSKNILVNRYLQKNSIQLTISVTPPSLLPIMSTNGSLAWEINNYNNKRQMVREDLLLSVQGPGYFYTDPKGYRVKSEFSWDSFDNAYIRISFVTGDHDADLPTSFFHKTTVTIFDQLTSHHFNKSVTKDIRLGKWYNIDLLSHNNILKGNYLKNGALLLKIIIEANKQ